MPESLAEKTKSFRNISFLFPGKVIRLWKCSSFNVKLQLFPFSQVWGGKLNYRPLITVSGRVSSIVHAWNKFYPPSWLVLKLALWKAYACKFIRAFRNILWVEIRDVSEVMFITDGEGFWKTGFAEWSRVNESKGIILIKRFIFEKLVGSKNVDEKNDRTGIIRLVHQSSYTLVQKFEKICYSNKCCSFVGFYVGISSVQDVGVEALLSISCDG